MRCGVRARARACGGSSGRPLDVAALQHLDTDLHRVPVEAQRHS